MEVWRGPVAVDSGTRLLAAPSYIVSDLAKAADVRDCTLRAEKHNKIYYLRGIEIIE